MNSDTLQAVIQNVQNIQKADTIQALQIAQSATHLVYTTVVGAIVWFIVGLLFVYLEIWMKQDVDESLLGPYLYAKDHARSVAFALLSYVAIYSLWLSVGLDFDINGSNIVSLEKGKINGIIVFVAYSSSAIFTAIAGKYQKVRNALPLDTTTLGEIPPKT